MALITAATRQDIDSTSLRKRSTGIPCQTLARAAQTLERFVGVMMCFHAFLQNNNGFLNYTFFSVFPTTAITLSSWPKNVYAIVSKGQLKIYECCQSLKLI